jgi:hypothetical protein
MNDRNGLVVHDQVQRGAGDGRAAAATDVHPRRPDRPPPPRIAAIPADLKERPQLVVWRYEFRNRRWTKVPYQPKHPERKARANVPETWGTFEEAWAAYRSGDFDGIGYEFTADDPYFGMDLDHCLGPDGEVLEWARPLLASIEGTYGEISPSGTGIKFFARGKLPGDEGKNRRGLGPDRTGAIELYDHGKFFTLTGNTWDDSAAIVDKQAAADALYAFAKERPAKPARAAREPARAKATAPRASGGNGVHDDREVLEAASRLAGFDALYRGDTTGYDSTSEADAGLMNHLAFLCGPGREAQVIRLYRGSTLATRDKADRDDYVEATAALAYRNRDEFFDWGPSANGRPEGRESGRVEIRVTTRRHEVLEQTIAALRRDPELYCRGASLGIVIAEDHDTAELIGGIDLKNARGTLRFSPLATSVLGCRLTRIASFYKAARDEHGEMTATDIHPPDWLVPAVAEHHYWPGVPHLRTITGCPYILADGSLARPGFDRTTGTLYRPSFTIPALPRRPTRAEAQEANETLYELVHQFPFDGIFSYPVWLANLLTCIQRPAIAGPTPGFAYVGNAAGCGKGLLIDLSGILVCGANVPTRTYPHDPVEADKVKLSLALAAIPIVHFDNINEGGSYGGGVIDSALTSMTTSGRILGLSRDSGAVPLTNVWTLSGNNIAPRGDGDRRWLPCHLATTLERPHERGDIEEKDLRGYTQEHRGELVHAALVILKAHALDGRPTGPADPKEPDGDRWAALGSYEIWDPIVRGAVWYATGIDCLHTQREGAKEKPDRLNKAALLEAWKEIDRDGKGKTIEEALELAATGVCPALREALMNLSRDGKLPTINDVKYRIRSMKKTPINRLRFEDKGENRKHQKLWTVGAC